MNTILEVPSTPPIEMSEGIKQPNALTPGVMVFFITICFLVLFRPKK